MRTTVTIDWEQYQKIKESGVKTVRIVAIEWEKAEASPVYYKNYKTWGWQSTGTKLNVFLEKEDGTIIKRDVYEYVLAKLGWKKLSEKRYSEFHSTFIGKTVKLNCFCA
jgi:hypothetical protein